ncbi:MAG TPA: hypothetical protein VF649_14655 [Sphingomonas sp.]|uniref:hypothetical protein n=1 Tax=Sphingomonas sp. TaxID=28214 RepID=UPI002ED9581E
MNQAFFRRLRARSPRYVVVADGIQVISPDGREHRLGFAELAAATLHHRDAYAYDAFVLALSFTNCETVEFAQDESQWGQLVDALDRSGRIQEPSTVWQLRAIGDGGGAPMRHLRITWAECVDSTTGIAARSISMRFTSAERS